MSVKSIPSELPRTPSLVSRLLFVFNFKRLKVWLWWLGLFAIIAACVFIEIQTSLLQSWIFTSTNERYLLQACKTAAAARSLFRARRHSTIGAVIRSCRRFSPGWKRKDTKSRQQTRQSETMLHACLSAAFRRPIWNGPIPALRFTGADGAPLFRYAQGGLSLRKIKRHPAAVGKNVAVSRKPRSRPSGDLVAKPGDRMGSHFQSGAVLHRRQTAICRCRCRAAARSPFNWKNFAIRPTAAPTRPAGKIAPNRRRQPQGLPRRPQHARLARAHHRRLSQHRARWRRRRATARSTVWAKGFTPGSACVCATSLRR